MKKSNALNATLSEIGEALTLLRLTKGFDTVTQFADAFNLPPNQYWKIENGKANITIKTLMTLLHIHGLSVHDFFCQIKEAK